MIKDTIFLNKNFYNKIKLYGFVKIKKNTTIIDKFIEKYIFYIESHEEKYELSLFTIKSEDEYADYDIKMYEVDDFEVPKPDNNCSIRFYISNNPIVHMSYDNFVDAIKPHTHVERNKVAKYITNKNYNDNFIISEILGIDILEQTDNKYLLENKDEQSEFCKIYINEEVIDNVTRQQISDIINPIETDCFLASQNLNDLEKLLVL